MTTRVIATDAAGTTIAKADDETQRDSSSMILHYLVCDDPNNHSPFVNPREEARVPTKKLEDSSSYRPWPCRSTTPQWILNLIIFFDKVFVSWWIMEFLALYDMLIPLWLKRKVTFVGWGWYVGMHKLVCKLMGFYSDRSFYTGCAMDTTIGTLLKSDDSLTISDCFKALSTLLYPVQFYPISVPMIRFCLSQLNVISLKDVPSEDLVERIEKCPGDSDDNFVAPETQRESQKVSGLYVTNPNMTESTNSKSPKKILFFIFGGAYLGGDAQGYLSFGNEFLIDCDADALFLPSYRLAPEAVFDDVLWDICWSYRYLLRRLQKEGHSGGYEIVMMGVSSGGALVLRLMQFLRDHTFQLPMTPSFLEPLVDDIIDISTDSSIRVAGGVMFGPYVDYRDPQPPEGSFLQNAKYDWVVTEAVQHCGLPYLNGFVPPMGDDLKSPGLKNTNGRIRYSPLCNDMNDLPPLCIITSEHEACYDMIVEVANKARKKPSGGGRPTDVTIGIWKHMCHVFSMMQALFPEGKASVDFCKEWIRTKTSN